MSKLNKEQFFLLLEKQKLGLCTNVEEKLLADWVDQTPILEQMTFISEIEESTIKSDIWSAVKEQIGEAKVDQPLQKSIVRPLFMRIAAAVVLCFSMGVVFYAIQRPENTVSIVIPIGIEKMPITLPDSSIAWLSGGSKITFPQRFSKTHRDVTLEGVGFFSVKSDKKAVFTVKTQEDISVKVLGTSFLVEVQKETNSISISVITGRVAVDKDRNQLDVLTPGECLLYSCQHHTYSKKGYKAEVIKGWKESSVIYLNSASIEELSTLFRIMYNVDLLYDKREVEPYRFNISFPKNLSADEVSKILKGVSGLNFRRDGSKITITK